MNSAASALTPAIVAAVAGALELVLFVAVDDVQLLSAKFFHVHAILIPLLAGVAWHLTRRRRMTARHRGVLVAVVAVVVGCFLGAYGVSIHEWIGHRLDPTYGLNSFGEPPDDPLSAISAAAMMGLAALVFVGWFAVPLAVGAAVAVAPVIERLERTIEGGSSGP